MIEVATSERLVARVETPPFFTSAKVWNMSEDEGVVENFIGLYRQIHDQLREEVSDLDPGALTRVLGPDTNSISTLVVHLLGSEAEVLRVVRGLPSDRNRTAEFSIGIEDRQELLSRIDGADQLLREIGPEITEEDLATPRVRPGAVRNRAPRSGLFWLMNSYGHAREHLGHLQLTKQLVGQTNS
jgi:hypothetical protein